MDIRRLTTPERLIMDQLTVNHRSELHLDEFVVDVPLDRRFLREFHVLERIHVAFYAAIDHNVWHSNFASDRSFFGNHNRRITITVSGHVALDMAIYVKLIYKMYVSTDLSVGGNERDTRFRAAFFFLAAALIFRAAALFLCGAACVLFSTNHDSCHSEAGHSHGPS